MKSERDSEASQWPIPGPIPAALPCSVRLPPSEAERLRRKARENQKRIPALLEAARARRKVPPAA